MPPHDLVQSLQQTIGHGGEQVFDVAPIVLRRVIEDRLWAQRKDRDGNLFPSFEAFVTHILWQGLESNIDELLLYCRKHPEVAELIRREVGAAEEQPRTATGKFTRSDNVKTDGGNNPTYALRRLKRDHPELAERVVSGEMSAHAAACEAGFRRRTIAVPSDLDGAVSALVKRFGFTQVREAIARLFLDAISRSSRGEAA